MFHLDKDLRFLDLGTDVPIWELPIIATQPFEYHCKMKGGSKK